MNNNIKSNSSEFESSNLVYFIYKWRKPLIIVTLAAIIISAVISFLITPKYKATVILFPAVTNSISKALLSETPQAKSDILSFGEEEEAEQTLQILNSEEIRSRIINKYNLLEHYDIEKDDKFKRTKLYNEYEDNISFERTEFMSVKITVLDKDPEIAANIANDIAALLDSTKNRMQKERAHEALKIVEEEYKKLVREVEIISDSLKKLRKLGVNDYETQSEVFNQEYAVALAKGNKAGAKALEDKLEILAEHGGEYVRLREALLLRLARLSVVQSKYQEVKVDAEQNLSHKFIVDRAYKAEKRSYPIRWLIVVTATAATFLLALLGIMLIENFSKVHRIEAEVK